MIGAAFGDSVARGNGLHAVGWDYYGRPFAIDLARGFAGPRPALI